MGACLAALKEAVHEATIETVRSPDAGGLTCGAPTELTVGERSTPVVSAWHYAEPGAAPARERPMASGLLRPIDTLPASEITLAYSKLVLYMETHV
jgi:hypothetical protein